jgi:hypothetical protein
MNIENVVSNYVDGYLMANSSLVADAFDAEAKMMDVKGETFIKDWLPALKEREAKKEIREAQREVFILDATDTTAVAKVVMKFKDFSLVDYLSLIKKENQWKIVNKVYHRNTL